MRVASADLELLICEPTEAFGWPRFPSGEFDCVGNMHIDTCEIAANHDLDCDKNGVLDVCDVLQPKADRNMNGIPDPCDVSSGLSENSDGKNSGTKTSCWTPQHSIPTRTMFLTPERSPVALSIKMTT